MMTRKERIDMANENHCSGGCSGCRSSQCSCSSCGHAAELVMTQPEIDFLQELAQIPFLPVARTMGDLTPVYLEKGEQHREQMSLVLQCMEKKGLISLDYSRPLKGFDDSAYAAYPIRGSMALTERGQKVLELIELQGIGQETDL